MKKYIYNLLGALFIPFTLSYLYFILLMLVRARNHKGLIYILIGGTAYLMLFYFFNKALKRDFNFVQTFYHEFLHAFFSLLSFNRIQSFNAHASKGGAVTYYGHRNVLITLAPYCIPLFALAVLSLKLLAVSSTFYALYAVTGFFLMFHFHTIKKDISPRQSDLTHYGLFFSYSFIALLNTLLTGYILISANGTFGIGWIYLKKGFLEVFELSLQ